MNYDHYNREERYLCSHLFRLLHEPAEDFMPLRRLLGVDAVVHPPRIYAEVALLRDAYMARRSSEDKRDQAGLFAMLNQIVGVLKRQTGVRDCVNYSGLVERSNGLLAPVRANPKQIYHKGQQAKLFQGAEAKVYKAMQDMFNSKPDLAICLGDNLYVFELKLTMNFDQQQFQRTRELAEIFAHVLSDDLGFRQRPTPEARTVGIGATGPFPDTHHTSWQQVLEIARETYPAGDRTLDAFQQATRLFEGLAT